MNAPTLEERSRNLARIASDLAACVTKEDFAAFRAQEEVVGFGTADLMLVLHEDIVERLKILGDAWTRPRASPRKRPKKAR